MERKIGEIFEYNGEWYQCLKSPDVGCKHCDMNFGGKCPIPIKECVASSRSDLYHVIFKKLEKVGEPIEFARGLYFQRYQLADSTAFYEGDTRLFFNAPTNTFVYIEIKTKEDMSNTETLWYGPDEKEAKSLKLSNLKPFSLEAAKAGKPVCTRDGRKARIICFDRKGYNMFPIVALIMNGDRESDIYTYRPNGTWDNSGNESDKDLMMLPEKKEGWVNVYREESNNNERLIEQTIYKTRKDAFDNACPKGYITTTKINWEE